MSKVRLSAPQRAYALAKAAYDTANQSVNEKLDQEFPPDTIPDDIWCNPNHAELFDRISNRLAELTEQMDVPNFRELLRKAEDCLLEWGHNTIKRKGGYTKDIRDLFEVHAGQLAHIRNELIDMTFKLSA